MDASSDYLLDLLSARYFRDHLLDLPPASYFRGSPPRPPFGELLPTTTSSHSLP
jgi:hypothetical protein